MVRAFLLGQGHSSAEGARPTETGTCHPFGHQCLPLPLPRSPGDPEALAGSTPAARCRLDGTFSGVGGPTPPPWLLPQRGQAVG